MAPSRSTRATRFAIALSLVVVGLTGAGARVRHSPLQSRSTKARASSPATAGARSRTRPFLSSAADSSASGGVARCRRLQHAARVDLAGKTVIPALVDGHSHIGYMKHLTSGAANYTRENILDHMRRFAYYGVAASQAMGSDFGELPFQLRDEILAGKHPDAARFLTAGRGLSPLSEISPDNMRQAAFPVTTPEGARAAVQELVPRRVRLVKTWVDDRGGAVKKLTPELYGAIIDEAHKNGLRVAVHATDLRVRQGSAARRHRRVRAHDRRRGRRAGRAVQAASEHRRPFGVGRAAPRRLRPVAESGAPADPRDRPARSDQAATGQVSADQPGSARAIGSGLGSSGPRHRRG